MVGRLQLSGSREEVGSVSMESKRRDEYMDGIDLYDKVFDRRVFHVSFHA